MASKTFAGFICGVWMLLMDVFVAIDVTVSVTAKQRAWLCLCGSLFSLVLWCAEHKNIAETALV